MSHRIFSLPNLGRSQPRGPLEVRGPEALLQHRLQHQPGLDQPSYSVMWSRYLDGLLKFATKLLIFAPVESMFCPYPMYSGTIGSTLRVVDYSLANSFDTDRLLHCSTKWK